MSHILIIDDDTFICQLLQTYLSNNGHKVDTAFNAWDANKKLKTSKYEIVLCDFRLPDSDGLEMLKKIKSAHPETQVVIITAYADVRMAVKLMKLGAYDYVTKPMQQEEILQLVKQITNPKNNKETSVIKEFIEGESGKMKEVIKLSEIVAPTDMSVLIEGETGSGKEYIARSIHEKSHRKNKAFVAVDCGAIPKDLSNSELFGHIKGSFTGAINDKKGVFEQANGGTLFLDEIGNLSHDVQIKLLRAIQERVITPVGGTKNIHVDVRIITATNEELETDVKKSTFREDLYHRLNEFKINIPPLRERKDDIIVFANHFMLLANKDLQKEVTQIDVEVLSLIHNYPWYGNLRELRNVIKRAVLLTQSDTIVLDSFPEEIRNNNTITKSETTYDKYEANKQIPKNYTPDLKDASKKFEREIILNTLEEVNYNKSKAARILNIDRKTLYNKMKMYEIGYTR